MSEPDCASRKREFCFEFGQSPERIDRFLVEVLPDLSRSQIKRLIDDGIVTLGGNPVKASHKLKGGDLLQLELPEITPTEVVAQDIPLNILYEDADLIVVDKPAGLVVHPAAGHADGTLVNALLYHCSDLAGIGGELRPGIVHRLDKGTSGVMVATKNDATHQGIGEQFRVHSINRRYVALVHGLPDLESGRIETQLGRHPVDRKRMASVSKGGRRALTHWKVLHRYDQDCLSLMELRLETGRTHQIRVHLSENKLPVAGDPVYTRSTRLRQIVDTAVRARVACLQRQALHARLLGFIHPRTGQYMEFTSELPQDMAQLIAALDKKYDFEQNTVLPNPENDGEH